MSESVLPMFFPGQHPIIHNESSMMHQKFELLLREFPATVMVDWACAALGALMPEMY